MSSTIYKKIISGLSWLLLIVPLILILVFAGMKISGRIPSLFGYSLYIIASPSMSPELQVGDIILNKEYEDSTQLNIGDVISYRGRSGEMSGKLITHKIVALEEGSDGLTVITRGTANPAADPAFTSDAIVSVMQCRVPFVGTIYKVLQKPLGFAVLFLLPMICFMAAEVKDLKKAIDQDVLRETEEVDRQ